MVHLQQCTTVKVINFHSVCDMKVSQWKWSLWFVLFCFCLSDHCESAIFNKEKGLLKSWGFFFLAVQNLCCCAGFSLVVVSRDYSSCNGKTYCHGFSCCGAPALGRTGFNGCCVWAQKLHGSRAPEHRLSSCGSWAQPLQGMWDPPGPGIESVSLRREVDSPPWVTREVYITFWFLITF